MQEIVKHVLALLCAIVGPSMIPLKAVPFAAGLPALAVIFPSSRVNYRRWRYYFYFPLWHSLYPYIL